MQNNTIHLHLTSEFIHTVLATFVVIVFVTFAFTLSVTLTFLSRPVTKSSIMVFTVSTNTWAKIPAIILFCACNIDIHLY